MADDNPTGIVGSIAKVLNDARYIPVVVTVVLFAITCLASKEPFADADPRRKLLVGIGFYAWWATMTGFIHTHYAWRLVKEKRRQLLESLSDNDKNDPERRKHAMSVAECEDVNDKIFYAMVGLYVAGVIAACFVSKEF
jgi:hypothetical protein